MHWDFALILIFLATAVPLLGRRRIQELLRIPGTTKAERLTLYASTTAFQWLAAALLLWRTAARGIPAASLGLHVPRPWLAAGVALALGGLIFANQLYSLRHLAATPRELQGVLPQLALKVFPQDAPERLAFFAVVVSVAFCEEWIYRGFAQSVFQDWGRSVIAGVVGSALLFAVAHLYQGRRGLVSTFAVGILFSAARAWTGSLLPSIAAHFVADLTAGYLAPRRVREALPRQQADASMRGQQSG
jgi:CAAX protease family protein